MPFVRLDNALKEPALLDKTVGVPSTALGDTMLTLIAVVQGLSNDPTAAPPSGMRSSPPTDGGLVEHAVEALSGTSDDPATTLSEVDCYAIANVQTGDYVRQSPEMDRSDIVTSKARNDKGSHVNLRPPT